MNPQPKPAPRAPRKPKPIAKTRAPRSRRCEHCQTRTTLNTCPTCKVRKGTKRTSLKARCDNLARALCRDLADGKCARCGGVGTDWAHRMPRRHHSMRWDMTNCDFLCRTCHGWFGRNPFAFKDWLVQRMGSNELSELERAANAPWDKSYDRVLTYLKETRVRLLGEVK